MTKQEIKALAYAESKKEKPKPPTNMCIVDYVYFLGCFYNYSFAKIVNQEKAKAYMPTLDQLYDAEMKKYPQWQSYYESNVSIAERIAELEKLFKAYCDNADNCTCCKAVKDWE